MVSLETCVDEEGAPRVAPRSDLRVFLGQLQREGFECHRAFTWPNCACLCSRVPEATFIRILKFLFLLLLLSVPVLNVIIMEPVFFPNASTWGFMSDQTWLFGRRGIVPLALFAVGIAIGLFVKRPAKNSGSAPAGSKNVISAVVQQV